MSASLPPNPNSGDVFDVRRVRRFVELMQEFDLSVVDLQQGDQRIRLRRGAPQAMMYAAPSQPAGSMPPSPSPPPVVGGVPAKPAAEDDKNSVIIRSPMVGTFYPSPAPDKPTFVKIGDRVGPETTVCIVEAMKVFNEIPAECSGVIAAVLATRGDPVEYNQPLFKVDVSK